VDSELERAQGTGSVANGERLGAAGDWEEGDWNPVLPGAWQTSCRWRQLPDEDWPRAWPGNEGAHQPAGLTDIRPLQDTGPRDS
jgi:hypothetical protein